MELGEGQKAVNDIYLALQADPRSFRLNVYFGRALLASGRLGDSLGQINRAYDLAEDDAQLGEALYWRAQVYEAIGNLPAAVRDWKKLLALPAEVLPKAWLETAQQHITITSTPAPTATRTPTFSRTPTITRTLTPTRTQTPASLDAQTVTPKP
jgi:tetratricopeptide (TPR) repeat protein